MMPWGRGERPGFPRAETARGFMEFWGISVLSISAAANIVSLFRDCKYRLYK